MTEFATYPSLAGRAVLITGGASGIGASVVEHFAAQGARVGFIDLDADSGADLQRRLGDAVRFEAADLRDIAALGRAIAAVRAAFGPITVLVNNAARDDRHTIDEVTPEFWDERMATNLKHQFFAAQAVKDDMIAAGGGAIVNMSSISFLLGQGGMPVYLTAKSAIVGLTRALARDLGPHKIRVNALFPGWIMTDRQIKLWLTPASEAEMLKGQCIPEKLFPPDIARMALWLAADDSRLVTAQNFVVDGGWTYMRIDCVVPARALVGEGPVWDDRAQVLWWVDIKAPALHRYDPATGANRSWPMPTRLGAVALRERGGLVGAFKNGFALIDPDLGAITSMVDPEAHLPGNRFNDGHVDAAGRFWAGTMDDAESDPTGHLYRLDPDGTVAAFEAAFAITNGIDWSLDGRTLYFVDTVGGMIFAYEFDPATGRPGARRLFARVPAAAGHPDGLVVDGEDHVWGAHWGGARLTRYRPDGSVERVLAIPAPQVSSACFGGPGLDILYVTTAAIGLDAATLAAYPDAGGLFAVSGLGIKGRPSRRFAG